MNRLSPEMVWVAIVIAGLGTFLLRSSFIYLFGRVQPSPTLESILRYIPAAVLSALVCPALLLMQGRMALPPENTRMMAGALAMIVAWKTKNITLTIASGMGALWLIEWFLG